VLAVIVGIGSGFFGEFTNALAGREPTLGDAMSLVLAALALFGLGIFGPSIASGLVAGGPQLGAGAALGTTIGAAGATMLAGGATFGAARMAGGAALGAIRAGTSMGTGASTAYALGRDTAASPSVGSGLGGVARAAGNSAKGAISERLGLGAAAERGRQAAFRALGGGGSPTSASASADRGMPDWARRLQHEQSARAHRHTALQTLKEGDRGGAAATPDIKERED
jgi:type IV secretion system protein TrbL